MPSLEARESKGVKVTFRDLSIDATSELQKNFDLVGFLVNNRVGLLLDVKVEGVSPGDIGWKSESDKVFFNFNLDEGDEETATFDPTFS